VLALILVSIIASVGMVFLRVSTVLTRRQTNDSDSLKAFYLAEAGLAEAFQAVRIGRSGQVGREELPAAYGDGLVWVDASRTVDDQVRLVSHALCGAGRTSLALVVEPIEVSLGFFSSQDLVIDSVILVDGYDAQAGDYQEQILGGQVTVDPSYPYTYDDARNHLLFFEGRFYRYYAREGDTYWFDFDADSATSYEVATFYQGGGLFEGLRNWLDAFRRPEYQAVLGFFEQTPNPLAGVDPTLGPTTGGGALFGSNGSIGFELPAGQSAVVFGDLVPGPEGSVTGLGAGGTVTGSTSSRTTVVELPPVTIPGVTLAPAVVHDGELPLLVSGGTFGYESIQVAADSELCLRGPATVVLGTLVLQPGALLTLDTRDGDVALYVTGGMDLAPGSQVVTTSDRSDETTIQVGAIASDPAGPALNLDATSEFHGTIYAPEADVKIGSDFEVFGGVVARHLEIGAGARLHFDQAGSAGSPIPRIISWRIVRLPGVARGARRDPYADLGVDRADVVPLAEAHDLTTVQMKIEYLDARGTALTFQGLESDFDWGTVAQVLHVDRNPTLVQETEPEPIAGETAQMRPAVQDMLDGYVVSGGTDQPRLVTGLINNSPLNSTELDYALRVLTDVAQESRLLAAQ